MSEENEEPQPPSANVSPADDYPFKEISHPKKRAFLIAFMGCGHIKNTAAAVHISTRSISNWRRDDPQFEAGFIEAQRMATLVLIDAAIERAVIGQDRLKFDKDGMACIDPRTGGVYVEHHCSDVLMIFLLKKLDPERFGDKSEERNGGNENEIRVVFEDDYSNNPNYQADAAASGNLAASGAV